MAFDLPADYKQVPERIADLKAKHPEATLQPADPSNPFQIVTVGGRDFIVYTAACYRAPDDPRPGIGIAWEPFPGKTPYTKDSELMNAETSAWGRAIVAALASESKAIASAEEVRNRQADAEAPRTRTRSAPAKVAAPPAPTTTRRPPPSPATNGAGPCATCSRPLGTDPVARSGGVLHHRACLQDPAPPAGQGAEGGEAHGAPAAPPSAPTTGVSAPQLGKIGALLSSLGVADDDRHRYVSALLDLPTPITSMKHLTKRQASAAIDALAAEEASVGT